MSITRQGHRKRSFNLSNIQLPSIGTTKPSIIGPAPRRDGRTTSNSPLGELNWSDEQLPTRPMASWISLVQFAIR